MPKKIIYDNIIVVKTETTNDSVNEESEIVEIGLCLFNPKTLRIHDKYQFLVKPKIVEINNSCYEQLGLTPEIFNTQSLEFKDVCDIIVNKFGSTKRPWASFNERDRQNLEKQCKVFNVKFPFNSRYINIKTLMPIMFGLNREMSLGESMLHCGIEPETIREAGVDEAWNAALLLKEIILGGVAATPVKNKTKSYETHYKKRSRYT